MGRRDNRRLSGPRAGARDDARFPPNNRRLTQLEDPARADEENRRTAEISGFAWRFEAPFDAQEPGVSSNDERPCSHPRACRRSPVRAAPLTHNLTYARREGCGKLGR